MELTEVRLIGVPVALHGQASAHNDELQREFTWIAAEPADVPARLVALARTLSDRYAGFTGAAREQLAAAAERGDPTVDVVYRVPADAGDAARELAALYDEADRFCQAGGMLTLSTPPDARAYRRWVLREFERQTAGEPPTPWSEWSAAHRSGGTTPA